MSWIRLRRTTTIGNRLHFWRVRPRGSHEWGRGLTNRLNVLADQLRALALTLNG